MIISILWSTYIIIDISNFSPYLPATKDPRTVDHRGVKGPRNSLRHDRSRPISPLSSPPARQEVFSSPREGATYSDLWISVFKRGAADTGPVPEGPGGFSLALENPLPSPPFEPPPYPLPEAAAFRGTRDQTRPKFLLRLENRSMDTFIRHEGGLHAFWIACTSQEAVLRVASGVASEAASREELWIALTN